MPGDLSPRMQDYLEAVLFLEQQRPVARAGEIAERLGVSNPTVSAALKKLDEGGYLEHESYGYVRLTQKGRGLARAVASRHRLLRGFLEDVLGLPAGLAADDACRLEHHVSPQTVERLTRFVEFLDICPRGGTEWLERFHCFCDGGAQDEGEARHCMERCVSACIEGMRSHAHPPCAADERAPLSNAKGS